MKPDEPASPLRSGESQQESAVGLTIEENLGRIEETLDKLWRRSADPAPGRNGSSALESLTALREQIAELTKERDQGRAEDRVHSMSATWAGERIAELERDRAAITAIAAKFQSDDGLTLADILSPLQFVERLMEELEKKQVK
jgi:hypothetical protein